MTPPKPIEYAMVTVQLDKPETDRTKAFAEIKSIFSLSTPDIDDNFGAIPNNGGKNEFVVLIEENLAHKLQADKHPNVTGVYANTKLDPFLTHGGCNPPHTRGGPRRNPKL